ncbi:hypothetical protein DE146DRAFT_631234 [Phaeosphaeria sp. MPI-PUGE-AT-0046c]|nr:hypothetical protein DE146DRAFT_631234 [Phaeosphaeria sp. MPI-PUGE-AT-0046c]
MKFTAICLIGLKVAGILSAALEPNINAGLARDMPENRAALEAECGKLGVLEVPEGVDASHVRHCAGHPNGRERFPNIDGDYPSGGWIDSADIATTDDNNGVDRRDPPPGQSAVSTPEVLFGRAAQKCWSGADKYGCSKNGWCWSSCVPEGVPKWLAQGMWCWMSHDNGWGKWMKCSKKEDCGSGKAGSCSRYSAPDCGCSC